MYLSRTEGLLLDEAQRCLYFDVMLENYALISSLGKTLTPCVPFFGMPASLFPQVYHLLLLSFIGPDQTCTQGAMDSSS